MIAGWLDVKLGYRMMVKYPGLTLVAGVALTVAIAIGAAAFEFARDLVNPTLPLAAGDRIVAIQNWDAAAGRPQERSLHDFAVWRDQVRSIEDLGAFTTRDINLVDGEGRGEPVQVAEITAAAFRLARVRPLLGRPFDESDEHEGAPPVAVIGYGVWQTRFGGEPAIIGRTIGLGETRTTIVGVMPEGFGFPVAHGVWVPLRFKLSAYPRLQGPAIRVVGRLGDGVSIEQAQAELNAIGLRSAGDFPDSNAQLRPRVVPYIRSYIDPAMAWQVYAMQSFCVLLLVVVAVNVAALMFARTASREGEIVLRTALGASRSRIVTQLFVEALVLTAAAAIVGLAIADWGLSSAMNVFWAAQGSGRPFWWNDNLSSATVLYAGGLALVGAAIAGVVPGLKGTQHSVQAGLQHLGAGGAGLRFGGVWTAVVVAQVALSVAFLPTAISEGREAVRAHPGGSNFPAEAYLSLRLESDAIDSSPDRTPTIAAHLATAFREIERQLLMQPGVESVTFADRLPGMEHPRRLVEMESDSLRSGEVTTARVHTASIGAGFFDALRTPIVAGRDFTASDLERNAAVAIVNEPFVRQLMGGRNPIGRRVRFVEDAGSDAGRWYEIVGVARDLGMDPLAPDAAAGLYKPAAIERLRPAHVAIRVRQDPTSLAPTVRTIVTAVDPALRLYDLQRLDAVARTGQLGARMVASVVALVAAVALMLSTVGIYSLMSFIVGQRTREIGIRAALGADGTQIVATIFARAVAQLGAGVVAGGLVAVISTVVELEDQIAREGPVLLIVVAVLMLAVGLLSCIPAAARALRIQPTDALRQRS